MISNISKMDFIFAAILLMSVSILNLGLLSILFFLLFLAALIITNRCKISIPSYIFVVFFFLIITYSYMYRVENPIDIAYIATFLYCFLCFLAFSVFDSYQINDKLRIVKFVISIHAFTLLIQTSFYLISGKYIDIHYAITMFTYESRYESNAIAFMGIPRSTGFSIEPSNAAALIIYLNLIYLVYKDRVDGFFIIGLLSTLLTLSFASIGVSISILIVSILYQTKKDGKIKLFLPYLILSLVLGVICLSIIIWRVKYAVDYDALGYRLKIIDYFVNADLYYLLFGQGIHIFELPTYFENILLNSSNIRDAGLLINVLFSFGLVGLFFIIVFLYICSPSFLIFICILLCSLLKFDYMQPIFWFLTFCILSRRFSFRR